MEAAHRPEQSGEAFTVSLVEERGEFVECLCRERLELVGGHHVSSIRTGCPWFLRSLRNPAARLEDTPRGPRNAAACLTGRVSV